MMGTDRQSDAVSPGTPHEGPAGPAATLRPGSPATGVPARRPRDGPGPHDCLQVSRYMARALHGDGESGTGYLPGEAAGPKEGRPAVPY